MTSGPGSIYEVTCFIDDEAIAAFDLWLKQRVRESLRLAVIADCRIFPIANNENGRGGRVCQHVLETDEALDEFVDGAGADIESSITAAFGDAVNVSSRILREDAALAMPDGESPDCLNCGARLPATNHHCCMTSTSGSVTTGSNVTCSRKPLSTGRRC